MAEDIADTAKDVAKDTAKNVAKDIAKDTVKDIAKDIMKEIVRCDYALQSIELSGRDGKGRDRERRIYDRIGLKEGTIQVAR